MRAMAPSLEAYRQLISDDAFALHGVDDIRGDLITLEPLHLSAREKIELHSYGSQGRRGIW